MNYYRLHDKNSAYPDRWYLGSPLTPAGEELDARMFTVGQPVANPGALRLPIARQGAAQEFTMADFDMPVLATSFVDDLWRVARGDFQAWPIVIDGESTAYSIINVVRVVDALDESRSAVARWPADTPLADLAGTYLTVSDIHIDPSRVRGEQMFRLDGWLSALIVSERVGAALADATGAVLERV